MSKIITSIALAVICSAIASFVISANPAVPFTEVHALLAGALLGLIIG